MRLPRAVLKLVDAAYLVTFSSKCLSKIIGHSLRFGQLLVVDSKMVTWQLPMAMFVLSSPTGNQCMLTGCKIKKLDGVRHAKT